jgi:phage head maturation protease
LDDHTLIYFGDTVKALPGGRVGGYLVKFSTADDPDLAGDFFTPDTDFDLYEGKRLPVLYDHGLDETLKRRKLGRASAKADDVGVWVEAQLELRDEYEKSVYELARQGKLGWSSGSASHLTERKSVGGAKQIVEWPIVEASLTPRPCEPRAECMPLKSYVESNHPTEPDPAPPDGVKFADTLDAVLAAVEGCTRRAREIHALRQAGGRSLSRERRARLAAVKANLDELLELTTPASEEGKQLLAEFLKLDAARLGVRV